MLRVVDRLSVNTKLAEPVSELAWVPMLSIPSPVELALSARLVACI
jgi:hypothetical protein